MHGTCHQVHEMLCGNVYSSQSSQNVHTSSLAVCLVVIMAVAKFIWAKNRHDFKLWATYESTCVYYFDSRNNDMGVLTCY